MKPRRRQMIKVVGVGGAGISAVNRLIDIGLNKIDLVAVDTNQQTLREQTKARVRVELGRDLVHGLGTGGSSEVGQKAAEACTDELYEVLRLSDILYVVAGLGGGTGSGAVPVIARIARDLHAEVIAVVGFPFGFEGVTRKQTAESALRLLDQHSDNLILLEQDRLLALTNQQPDLLDAFALATNALAWQVLLDCVKRSP